MDEASHQQQATTVLVLGIVGLVACQALGPIAWYLANQELKACEAAGIQPDGMLIVGRVLGMVGTIMLVLLLIAGLAYIGFIVAMFGCSFLYMAFVFFIVLVGAAAGA